MPRILGVNYRSFQHDSYRDLMPKLVKAGYSPMSIAYAMRARLDAIKSGDSEQKRRWLNRGISTIDGIAFYGDKIKLVLDAEPLLNIRPDSELTPEGNLPLTPREYKSLIGKEFSLKDVWYRDNFDKDEAMKNLIWQYVARDKGLLREYVDEFFKETKRKFKAYTSMGIEIRPVQNKPSLAALGMWPFERIGPDLVVHNHLGSHYHSVHLIGLSEHPPDKETLERRIKKASK